MPLVLHAELPSVIMLLPMMISSPYAAYAMYLFCYCWSPYLYTRIDSDDDALVRMREIPQ